MRKRSLLFAASLVFSSSLAMAGTATYPGQTCVSCHDNSGGKSQAPIVSNTGSLSSTNERMSALGIRALAASSASCSTSSKSMMYKAYRAYYNRCPDENGLAYWCGRLDGNGGDISSLIASFGTSAEYTQRFSNMSDSQLINNLYLNMFNRDSETVGRDFYINLLGQRRTDFRNSHGGSSNGATEYGLSRIALDVLNGANDDPSGIDLTILEKKISVCSTAINPNYFLPELLSIIENLLLDE